VTGRLLSLALLLAAAGCGRKTDVKPPELAAPEVVEIAAENRVDGVRLIWSRPRSYADGSRMYNLAGFRLQRRQDEGSFVQIAELPVTDRERFRQIRRFHYLDRSAIEGFEYEYRVLSFTLDNYVSAPSNVVSILRVPPSPTPVPEPATGATPAPR
jgi:hypothetical protein